MSGYFEIYRGFVAAWECDIMGHMNVQFYHGKAAEGLAHLRAACGMPPAYVRDTRHTMLPVRTLTRYRRELQAGQTIHIDAAVTAVGADSVDLIVDIMNSETGTLSCGFDMTCMSHDLDSGQPVAWPAEVRERLEAMVTPRRDEPRPAATGGPGLATAPGNGFAAPFVSARGSVMTWECDEHGHMGLRFFMARAADAIGHVKERIGFKRELTRQLGWGSAALEYTIDFRRPMRAGDIYSMRSGLLDVGDRTFRFGHVLSEDCCGEICATYDAIGCMFDLQARKAMAIPEDLGRRARDFIIAWPQTEAPPPFSTGAAM